MEELKDYEKQYNEFWKSIVEDVDGNINKDQMMRELYDFNTLINNIPKLYSNITCGQISKPLTDIIHIENIIEERLSNAYEEGYADAVEELK